MEHPPGFDRQIHVFVRDGENYLIPGATIRWKVNDKDAGTVDNSDGHGTISVKDPAAIVEASVIYQNETKTERLGIANDTITFVYPNVRVNPTWKRFMTQHIAWMAGIVFILIAVVLSFAFSNQTPIQIHVILAVLALGGGAFASEIPGMIQVKVSLGQRIAIAATGALAIFVVLYLVVPAT